MKQNKKQSTPSPSTRTYNELLCKVDTGRGAPMGRPSIGDRSGVTGQRIYCRRVYLPIDGSLRQRRRLLGLWSTPLCRVHA